MPRPLRLEYEGAFYHVMNRGRGRQTIFHNNAYYSAFIETLVEAQHRFNAVVHAYCLMGNHYHLLLETPDANLGRIMRHVNGVFTQRYNRLKKTDGPLFRGRYKAILVDEDSYLLPLSRYIHRNPIETKKPLVKSLDEYVWSSYSAYVGTKLAPPWLMREQIFDVLGKHRKYQTYRNFVELGVDEELASFYSKANLAAVLGDKDFRKHALKKNTAEMNIRHEKKVLTRPTAHQIIKAVAEEFNVSETQIIIAQQGRQQRNLPRKVAMYLCQHSSDMTLQLIADMFGMGHKGGVSNALTEIRRMLSEEGELQRQTQKIMKMIQ